MVSYRPNSSTVGRLTQAAPHLAVGRRGDYSPLLRDQISVYVLSSPTIRRA